MIVCTAACGYCGRCDDDVDGELLPNARCADCGVEYSKAETDPSTWCDRCSDRRDAWAAATEIRLMAKAFLKVDPLSIKDVA